MDTEDGYMACTGYTNYFGNPETKTSLPLPLGSFHRMKLPHGISTYKTT